MIWERFHYICRRCHETIKPGQSVNDCISIIDVEPETDLYGQKYTKNSIANHLLNTVKNLSDQPSAKKFIEFYGKQDYSTQLNEPMHFKKVITYLSYVILIFFILSTVYYSFVVPGFLNILDTFELSIPAYLMFYENYWLYAILLFSILQIGLLLGYKLSQLFKYRLDTQNSFIFKYLTHQKIKKSYFNILELIYFPISGSVKNANIRTSVISKHLRNMENSGMDINREIQEIMKRESLNLTRLCDRQMTFISTLISVIVVASIFFFLVSAYSAIFALGEIL